MIPQILFGVVIVPAVVGLVQVAKQAGIPSRFAPAVAVALGVLASLAQLYAVRMPWIQAAVVGVALGLSAVGLYSTGSTLLNSYQNPEKQGDTAVIAEKTPRT